MFELTGKYKMVENNFKSLYSEGDLLVWNKEKKWGVSGDDKLFSVDRKENEGEKWFYSGNVLEGIQTTRMGIIPVENSYEEKIPEGELISRNSYLEIIMKEGN